MSCSISEPGHQVRRIDLAAPYSEATAPVTALDSGPASRTVDLSPLIISGPGAGIGGKRKLRALINRGSAQSTGAPPHTGRWLAEKQQHGTRRRATSVGAEVGGYRLRKKLLCPGCDVASTSVPAPVGGEPLSRSPQSRVVCYNPKTRFRGLSPEDEGDGRQDTLGQRGVRSLPGALTCGPSPRLVDIWAYMCARRCRWAEYCGSGLSTRGNSLARPKSLSLFATREPRKRVSKETAKGS